MSIKRFRIKDAYGVSVHWDGAVGDQTLCGLEMQGDSLAELEEAKPTRAEVDCEHCLQIYNHCLEIYRDK